jgi:hypothetical protein
MMDYNKFFEGVHPDQLKSKPKHKNKLPTYKTDAVELSNTIQDGGRANVVMANLY